MSKLVLHIPGGGTKDIKLDRERITIGRRADNDIWLPYPAVSAEHAAVITVRGDSFLEDLQSTNGTLVNGKVITKHFLRDHDLIDVARVQFIYVANEDELIEPLAADTEMVAPSAPTSSDAGDDEHDPASFEERESNNEAPAEQLLAELMNSSGASTVAVEIPPLVSGVPAGSAGNESPLRSDATAGVFLEVMSGPNAGQIAPLTKREFMLGKAGATKAVIRGEGDLFRIVPLDSGVAAFLNGTRVPNEGALLAYGDSLEVAGVKLRFGRRAPL